MKVALIQFKEVGKKYYFSFDFDLKEQEDVVVETARGIEVGRVYQIKDMTEEALLLELKPVIRKATLEDIEMQQENIALEKEVLKEVKSLVISFDLEMKITATEYTLDRKRLMIFFESEKRIDFRELVKVLGEMYKTRIEMRQIGPRDAAKMIGGIGPCGLILCCTTFIGEFDTVSIKMAKNQNISLNPQKISGVCGKLLCCIKYEDDVYTTLKINMPDVGQRVLTEKGKAVVTSINILGQKVKLKYLEEDTIEWEHIDQLKHTHA